MHLRWWGDTNGGWTVSRGRGGMDMGVVLLLAWKLNMGVRLGMGVNMSMGLGVGMGMGMGMQMWVSMGV